MRIKFGNSGHAMGRRSAGSSHPPRAPGGACTQSRGSPGSRIYARSSPLPSLTPRHGALDPRIAHVVDKKLTALIDPAGELDLLRPTPEDVRRSAEIEIAGSFRSRKHNSIWVYRPAPTRLWITLAHLEVDMRAG